MRLDDESRGGRRDRSPRPSGPARSGAAGCLECGSSTTLIPIGDDEAAICLRCVSTHLHGCIPEHVGWGELRPVYWWWCVCGRQVRDSRFTIDADRLDERQAAEVYAYRAKVVGVPSGGVMLCRRCAKGAGVALPAPAPARVPAGIAGKVIDLASRRRYRRQ